MASRATGLGTLTAYIKALRIVGKGGGAKRVSKQLAEEAKSLIDEGFAKGQAPDGTKWAPLVARAGQPLRDTGRLQRSLAPVDTGQGFRVTTNVPYAAVHQSGARIMAKKARVLFNARTGQHFGKSVTIPARPFLPDEGEALPPRWQEALDEVAEETIALLLKGK